MDEIVHFTICVRRCLLKLSSIFSLAFNKAMLLNSLLWGYIVRSPNSSCLATKRNSFWQVIWLKSWILTLKWLWWRLIRARKLYSYWLGNTDVDVAVGVRGHSWCFLDTRTGYLRLKSSLVCCNSTVLASRSLLKIIAATRTYATCASTSDHRWCLFYGRMGSCWTKDRFVELYLTLSCIASVLVLAFEMFVLNRLVWMSIVFCLYLWSLCILRGPRLSSICLICANILRALQLHSCSLSSVSFAILQHVIVYVDYRQYYRSSQVSFPYWPMHWPSLALFSALIAIGAKSASLRHWYLKSWRIDDCS